MESTQMFPSTFDMESNISVPFEPEEEENTIIRCSNCHKELEGEIVELHEAYCSKFMTRCPKCRELLHRDALEEHEHKVHRVVPCEYCKSEVEIGLKSSHQCKTKPKPCHYCSGLFSHKEYNEHVYQCGSRTQVCEVCFEYVLLREYDCHLAACMNGEEPGYYGNNNTKEMEQLSYTFSKTTTKDSESSEEDQLVEMQYLMQFVKKPKGPKGKQPRKASQNCVTTINDCNNRLNEIFEEEDMNYQGSKKRRNNRRKLKKASAEDITVTSDVLKAAPKAQPKKKKNKNLNFE